MQPTQQCAVVSSIKSAKWSCISSHVWLQDVEPYTVVAGNPARVIKRLARQRQEEQ